MKTLRERAIGDLKAAGWTSEDVARVLGVHISTVYRRINALHDKREAQQDAEARRLDLDAILDPEGIHS